MAQRLFTSQFSYSFERYLVELLGSFTQSGSTGTFATLTQEGITYTAKRMGTYGNGISVALVGGGTAGAETVAVTNKAIVVTIEDGVSTRTQVKTAVDNSTAAAALVSTSAASGATAANAHVAQNLSTGVDTAFTSTAKGFSMTQIAQGQFEITLQDSYNSLLAFCATVMEPSDNNQWSTQIISADPTTAKTIVFATKQNGGSEQNLVDGDAIFIDMKLRNSSS